MATTKQHGRKKPPRIERTVIYRAYSGDGHYQAIGRTKKQALDHLRKVMRLNGLSIE